MNTTLKNSRPLFTSKHDHPLPIRDNAWDVAVVELEACHQFWPGVFERAQAEMIGEKDESQVWQIMLSPKDLREYSRMQRQGAVLIRKTLKSILGRAVLVDIIVPETEPA